MKKIVTTMMALVLMVTAGVVVTSCGAGTLLQTVASGGTLANAFSSVIGLDKVTKQGMVGTWHYDSPGCAFTSENLLSTRMVRSVLLLLVNSLLAPGRWTSLRPR